MTTSLQKYKLTCWLFQTEPMIYYSRGNSKETHGHHIKPKAKYPELAKSHRNIINVPPILHAVLHHWLCQAYMDAGNEKDAKRFDVARNIIDYINEHDNKRELLIDDLEIFAETYWPRICDAVKAVKSLSMPIGDMLRIDKNFNYYTQRRKNNRISKEDALKILAELNAAKDTCKALLKTDAYIIKSFAKGKKDMLDYDANEIDEIITGINDNEIVFTNDMKGVDFFDDDLEEQYNKLCKEIDDEKAAQNRDEKALWEEN